MAVSIPAWCEQPTRSLTFFHGATPVNDVDVNINALKFSTRLKNIKWLDGISFIYGKYDGVWDRDDTYWYAAGPYWTLWSSQYGEISLEFAPTYIDQRFMAGHIVGSNWHFTTALEYTLPVTRIKPFAIGLRYQHTSNAGVKSPNPGIDGIGVFVQASW